MPQNTKHDASHIFVYNPRRKRTLVRPDFIATGITDIDFSYLRSKGIKAIFIDLDGTVVARGQYEVNPAITKTLRSQPLPVYIATNRPKSRDLKNLKESLHAQGVIHPRGFAGKPFPAYFKQACRLHGYQPNEVLMIGDRYIQDIIGANGAGLFTAVVFKLDTPTNFFDTLLSATERKLSHYFARTYRPVK